MPGKSKKGGGLEVGSPYKMKGFSGFGKGTSPLKQDTTTIKVEDMWNYESDHVYPDGKTAAEGSIWPKPNNPHRVKVKQDEYDFQKSFNEGIRENMIKAGKIKPTADDVGRIVGKKAKEVGKKAAKTKSTKSTKPYVKSGGKATGNIKDYAHGSKERYAEYEARGWKQDETTKGGEPLVHV